MFVLSWDLTLLAADREVKPGSSGRLRVGLARNWQVKTCSRPKPVHNHSYWVGYGYKLSLGNRLVKSEPTQHVF